AGADPHPFGEPGEEVGRRDVLEEGQAGGLAGPEDPRAGGSHVRGVRFVVLIRIAHRHAHVARAPLRKRDPRTPRARLDTGERADVLDLEAEQELAARVEWPGIGGREVAVDREPPDLGGALLAAVAAAPDAQRRAHAGRVEREARALDEGADGVWHLGVAEEEAVDAGGEDLLHHPRVRPYRLRAHAL